MTTANFAIWHGNMSEMGAIYPLVGWEVPIFLIGLAMWILWHILTIIQEEKEHKKHAEAHGDRDSLTEIMERESLVMRKQARREQF
jgi:hypothetical protein